MSLMIKVGVDSAGVQTGLAKVEGMVSRFGSKLAGGLAAGFGGAALAMAAKDAIELADRLDDLSKRFDVSAQGLQLIGNVAKENGSDLEAVGQSMKFLGKNAQLAAQQGGGDLAKAFAAIGLSSADLRRLKPDEIFLRLADAMSSGQLSGQEFAVASQLLGRGFEQLLPLLRMGRAEIEKIGTSKGLFSDQTIRQLAAIEDFLQKINNLKKVAVGEFMSSAINSFNDFLKQAPPGSPAASLQKMLFGETKAPAARRSGGVSIKSASADFLDEERMKELQKQDTEEARFELKLIEARIDGRRKAEQILQNFEDRIAEENIRQAEERAKAAMEAAGRIEDIRAQRSGPEAEMSLTARRAQEAADIARRTQSTQDILVAEELKSKLFDQLTTVLETRGYEKNAARSVAEESLQRALGIIPAGLSPSDMANLSMKTQPAVKQETVNKISQDLTTAVNKLDSILKASGVFTY